MSHSRQVSEASRAPHSVSLKVLRLSKPQLSFQFPLPRHSSDGMPKIDPRAALSHLPVEPQGEAVISPMLTLPPSFGTVHVGETFSCTLCANNEVASQSSPVMINGVRISAVMQTPSNSDGVTLRLFASHAQAHEAEDEPTGESAPSSDPPVTLSAGETLGRLVRFDLREEGQHVLAVTVTYTESYPQAPLGDETAHGLTPITRGKVRTFRKLYQFMAHQLLSVRTKAQMLPPRYNEASEFVLEAQLENSGDTSVVLDALNMTPSAGMAVRSLNAWDMPEVKQRNQSLTLDPKQVLQSCFLFRVDNEADAKQQAKDARTTLGQLSIDWRGVMGEKGSLSTGVLSAKRKY